MIKCRRREELFWDLTRVQEVLRENEISLVSLSGFCLSLSVILYQLTAAQLGVVIQKSSMKCN